MFKNAIIALTTAAILAGTAATFSAPAEAHEFFPIGHGPVILHGPVIGRGPVIWHGPIISHPGYWNHPHFWGAPIVASVGDCYWVTRDEKIWTPDGPIFQKRNVQVCN